jgi:2-polyprenyl-3-methyl-5-hydroxy-6-metoxy-1,4-benzoquinol methylase
VSLNRQSPTCIVCGGANLKPFWRVLKKCASCGHCVADIDLDSLDFSRIYQDSYFAGEEYENYLGDREVFKRQFEDRLREVMAFRKQGDLIEIGCAYGFFLEVAQAFFRVRGFDICQGPVRFAQEQLGLPASCEDFTPASVPPATVDLVAMWDTIEHLPRPDLTLKAASHALRPGGYIFITTGDIGSLLSLIAASRLNQLSFVLNTRDIMLVVGKKV